MIFALSCSKDNQINICNTDEPLKDLEWLKSIVKSLKDNGSPSEIVVYDYNNNDIFFINQCVRCSDFVTSVYDCAGNEICKFGGLAGLNTCPDFSPVIEKTVLFRSN